MTDIKKNQQKKVDKQAEEKPRAFISDMDGVLIRGNHPIPGAQEFINTLREKAIPFMLLTNNSRFTPRDHQARLSSIGIDIPADSIFTSALATANFLDSQRPNGSAFVVGEAGLTTALHEVGYVLTAHNPDYVVLGETPYYSYESLTTAIRLIENGARFIGTNPDVTGPSEAGTTPATGSVAALITAATKVQPYFVGKPNPLMIRSALRKMGAHSGYTTMIGDRMDTDIVAGTESGMETILVLTGVTSEKDIERFPYRPGRVVNSIADIEL